eukprot:CAMPEP_0197479670 /NCGR_PEP_ID=MMETSP1309-20131121/35688_1 /TAXON_ID=464262 /ORGANISM="Genus nov. species nov., Strain RCC998" /LENGTH=79 /DNA_ID=CAMNT_0043021409 /DNA_START=66 /DNA_END=301 /DNA_ORIENTATION=+
MSIGDLLFLRIAHSAVSTFLEPTDAAKPFPDPVGTIPRATSFALSESSRLKSPLQTSCKVPSPPMITNASKTSKSTFLA